MLEINKATEADFSGIINVLHYNLLSKKENADAPELSHTGFLVHGFDENDLKKYSTNEDALLITAKDNKKVVGYEIAYLMTDEDKKSLWEKCKFLDDISANLAATKILYHRHIAKLPEHKGVATLLMNELIAYGKHKKCENILCMIAQKPLHNLASEKFHSQYEFKQVASLFNSEEQKTYGVFIKKI